MGKVIHIVNDDGIELEVAVTEEELALFRDAALQAAESGKQLVNAEGASQSMSL